ncbi:MAG: sorbosone dehydrogenase family protein [Solibacillus sp.]
MPKLMAIFDVTLLLLVGCSEKERQNVMKEVGQVKGVNEAKVIAQNLSAPWAIENTFFITERTGAIVEIQDNNMTRQKVQLKQRLSTASEAGLLGFVLVPDFANSNQAFAYYTYEKGSNQFNRIVLLQLENDVWHEGELLVDEIPSGTYHHGGRLKIGPDSKLYATAGDASNPKLAQDKASLAGKILRLNLDGSIPDDNPFNHSYVFSYGHRNPQGLTWTADGKMYATEHGQSANDEVNEIQAGKNYGWPIIEGSEQQQGLVTPLFTSGASTTWAPSGMASDNGELYVAALRGTDILAFDLQTKKVREIINNVGRIRDVWIEGDTLYWITNNTDGRGQASKEDDQLFKLEL